jgi:hypothetical protein
MLAFRNRPRGASVPVFSCKAKPMPQTIPLTIGCVPFAVEPSACRKCTVQSATRGFHVGIAILYPHAFSRPEREHRELGCDRTCGTVATGKVAAIITDRHRLVTEFADDFSPSGSIDLREGSASRRSVGQCAVGKAVALASNPTAAHLAWRRPAGPPAPRSCCRRHERRRPAGGGASRQPGDRKITSRPSRRHGFDRQA